MSWITTTLMFLGLLGMSLGAGNTQTSKAKVGGELVSQQPQVMYKGDNFVLENRGFSVMCNLTLFDQLKWTHNGNPIVAGEGGYWIMEKPAPQGFIGSQVTVAKAQLRHAGEYKCSSLQQRFHSVFIIRDSPSNSNTVKNIKLGHTLKLQCNNMTSSEAVTFELAWYKDDERLKESDRIKIFQLNSSLIISSAEEEDVGSYKCEVINDTLVEKIPTQYFKVIWLEVKNLPKSSTVTMQEPLVLEIPVKGKPTPSISWMKDDRSISDIFNSSMVKYEANSYGVPRAKLTISSAQMNYRGTYTCTITIYSMTHTTATFVRVKDVYAALWPFLGIVVEVVVLGIVIFIFEKRRAKAEFEESDTDQGYDQKNTADNNKRQRK